MSEQHRVSMGAFKKSAWTPEEDMQLVNYINRFGIWNWCQMPKFAGLSRSGKSCRLRWVNYLNPDIKRGNYSQEEDEIIINMRQMMGVGWSAIAEKLPGRTDNEIKNRWHTHLKKRLHNINPIGSMESQIGTILNCDCSNFVSNDAPKASKPELAYEKIPIASYTLNIIGSDTLSNPPTHGDYESQKTDVLSIDPLGTIEDPHVNFWRKPFSLEDDHHTANYVEYPGLLSMPQDWYEEPINPYNYCPDSCDYWFKLLTITGDLDEMMDVYEY